jgi:hypothetical protein
MQNSRKFSKHADVILLQRLLKATNCDSLGCLLLELLPELEVNTILVIRYIESTSHTDLYWIIFCVLIKKIHGFNIKKNSKSKSFFNSLDGREDNVLTFRSTDRSRCILCVGLVLAIFN